tara:strand:- start:1701 stop:2486 length:786 start_codon:yes stop_codon:yes gene_type:complete
MFSENLKKLIDSSFENTNFGRILLLDRFEKLINQVGFSNKLSVAVIGGTKDEPEITLLKSMGFDLDVYTYGIEDYDDFYFDLNEENKDLLSQDFDLIICGQVLEHIWNSLNFSENICKLMNTETLTFIHCPKSNYHHGHTYYSAGYSKEFLKEIFTNRIEIINYGELGTPRLYTSIHLLKHWINTKEAMAGKISYDTWFSYLWNLKNSKPKIRNFSKKILFQISFKRILINILLQGLENIENNDKLVKSESYIFFKLAKKI